MDDSRYYHPRPLPSCHKANHPELRWQTEPSWDLPASRLHLYKPAFCSTGMDRFRPYNIKLDSKTEKRCAIMFKCLTTQSVHMNSIDTDSFLVKVLKWTLLSAIIWGCNGHRAVCFYPNKFNLISIKSYISLSLTPPKCVSLFSVILPGVIFLCLGSLVEQACFCSH